MRQAKAWGGRENGLRQRAATKPRRPAEILISWEVDTICYGSSTSAEVNVVNAFGDYEVDLNDADLTELYAGNYEIDVIDEHEHEEKEMMKISIQ